MTWTHYFKGFYGAPHRGAGGGNDDPDGWELFTGAQWPTWRQVMKPFEVNGASIAAAHHVYKKAPVGGQAASVPPVVAGVPSNDRPHTRELDGHRDSAISSHPDGQYAQNTAATSDYSLGANYAIFKGPYPGGGLRPVALPSHTTLVPGTPHGDAGTVLRGGGTATASRLSEQRTSRLPLGEQPELLVKAETSTGYRWRSVLEREWTVPQLALGAAGVYMVYSAF
jgi:hypothetical protein